MPAQDPRLDDYISKSADFAKPVLTYLRDIVHKACPAVNETMKWSFPNFEYAGGILCSMAAFKQHCTFGFWLASLMTDPDKLLAVGEKTSMGHFGQIKSVADLPSEEVLVKYIKEAMALNEKGAKIQRKEKAAATKEVEIPPYFLDALKENKAAFTAFEKFSPSHKKEYLEWITEAKTEATRNKRIATALEWLEEGKSRNWKYSKC
ncbi:MAG: YdeI/OmpD-associated family protein [Segetibacter sp.]